MFGFFKKKDKTLSVNTAVEKLTHPSIDQQLKDLRINVQPPADDSEVLPKEENTLPDALPPKKAHQPLWAPPSSPAHSPPSQPITKGQLTKIEENLPLAEEEFSQAETESAKITPVEAKDQIQETDAPTPTKMEYASADSDSNLSWHTRLRRGLAKSRDKLNKSLATIAGGGKINAVLYEELEEALLQADVGLKAAQSLLEDVRNRVNLKGLKNPDQLKAALKDALYDLILPLETHEPVIDSAPYVIMMVGVNGSGKTTTIGKLAHHYQEKGKSIIMGAGDTFRAAAKEQLKAWGERNNVTVIAQDRGDSASICFDTLKAAKARKKDIALLDTAGRLPSQANLMEEIKKVKRVVQKALPKAPQEIFAVLDASIGQNALSQVQAFDDALGLTGLIITKLDGSAKGGMVAALAKERPIPIRYIGVGEAIEDLRPFQAKEFVDAFFTEE